MRTKVIFRDLGAILKYLSFVFLAPAVVSVIYGEDLSLFIFAGLFVVIFLLSRALGKFFHSDEETKLQESMVTVALIWLTAAIFSSLPFLFFGESFLDALFEAMSAWTTTGLSAVNVASLPQSLLFWRSIMQWVGGLGIIALALGGIFRTSSSLYFGEAHEERIRPNIFNTIKTMWWVYAVYTLLGILGLKLAGLNFFEAVNHAMTAMSTGGMSTRAGGIAEFNLPVVEIVLMVLMVLGAVSFLTHYRLFKGKKFFKDPQLISLLVLIFIFSGLLLFSTGARAAVFQVVTALTGTGFSTVPLASWSQAPVFLLIVLMIIGGSAGSTAGGLKLIRVLVFFKLIFGKLKKLIKPHLILPQRVGRINFSNQEISNIVTFIGIYFLIFTISIFLLMLTGYSSFEAIFQAASAFGSVGLTVVDNFGTIPKVIMIFDMWVGRLEIWAVLVLLYSIWPFKRRSV